MRNCRLGGLSGPALEAIGLPHNLGLAPEPLARLSHPRSADRMGASTFPQAM